jgi:hypothetical protein
MSEDEAPTQTEVVFLHGRAYSKGFALDVVSAESGIEGHWAVQWKDLQQNANWLPHDMVELFMAYTLPKVADALEERDFVLYLDCLRMDCPNPHLYTRKMLDAAGYLAAEDDDDDVFEIEETP